MGSKTNLISRRIRNRKQKRRLRRGLIVGSVVAFLALLYFGSNAYRSYCFDRAIAMAQSSEDGTYTVESQETSLMDYLIPLRGAPASTTVHTVSTAMKAYKPDKTTVFNPTYDPGTVTPSSVTVTQGGSVTLKATPAAGYLFLKWIDGSGNEISTNSVLTVTNVNADVTYTAVFYLYAIRAEYEVVPAGGGYLDNTPEYLQVYPGDIVYRPCIPHAMSGYNDATWSTVNLTPDSTPSSTQYTVQDLNKTVKFTATFAKKKTLTIAVASGQGWVVDGDHTGSDHAPDGDSYLTREVGNGKYTFTAVLPRDVKMARIYDAQTMDREDCMAYEFDESYSSSHPHGYKRDDRGHRWYSIEVDCSKFSTSKTFVIEVDADSDASSFYSSVVTVAQPPEGGKTAGDMSVPGKNSINTTLSATASPGYMFDHWEFFEDKQLKTSRTANMQVSVSGLHVYTAVFVQDTYNIDIIADPENAGTFAGEGRQAAHSDAVVRAWPADGYQFDKWTWKTSDGESHESGNDRMIIPDIMDDYTLTAHFSKLNPMVSVTVNPIGANSGGTLYNYVQMTNGNNDWKTDGTTGSVSTTVANGATVTLQAFPNNSEDYAFAYWVDQDGNTSSANPYSIGDIKDDQSYIAVFTKKQDKYELRAVPDPDGAGTFNFTITNPAGSFVDRGQVEPHANADVTATPTPGAGYMFEKWTWKTAEGIEHESKEATLHLTDIMQDYTLTGHFIKASPKVTVNVSPLGKVGSLFNYAKLTDGSNAANTATTDDTAGTGNITVTGGSAVTLHATPNADEGYVFTAWVDQDGNVSTANPYTIGSVTDDMTITAVFTQQEEKFEVKAYPDPDDAGYFDFVIDNQDGTQETFRDKGRVLPHATATVTPHENGGYMFDKWTWKTKEGVDRESRANPLIINDIMEDITLMGHFVKANPRITVNVDPLGEKDGDYNYVEITDSAGGSARTNSTATGYLDATGGSVVTLKAVPNKKRNSEFSYWVDEDGNTSSANPYVIGKADKDKTFYAIFTSKDDDDITVLASPPSGGKVTCKKTDAGGYTITAKANRGYTFQYWKCADTGKIIKSKNYTMDAAEGANHYTYIAYFKGDKDARFTSDLTREYFPNIRRLFKDPNYKYTRSSWAASVSTFINSIRGNYPKASGSPSNLAAFAATEEAMNAKAAELAPVVITAQSELITTDNEIIPVTDHADTDSALERALAITEEKFGDRYTPEVICVKDVSAPNGFVDGVRTYLWYDTGVEKNDNLFIIYEMNGSERIVTPIADRKGTLRFTIDKLGSMNRFALVRVTVE